jgi:hypothetical protein
MCANLCNLWLNQLIFEIDIEIDIANSCHSLEIKTLLNFS